MPGLLILMWFPLQSFSYDGQCPGRLSGRQDLRCLLQRGLAVHATALALESLPQGGYNLLGLVCLGPHVLEHNEKT